MNTAIEDRINYVALAIAYQQGMDVCEVRQQMWLELMERATDTDFMARPVNQIVNKLSWEVRSYYRHERRRETREQQAGTPFTTQTLDDSMWLSEAVEDVISALGGKAETVARHLMAGQSKRETADTMGLLPSNVTYYVVKLRAAFGEAGIR